MKQKAFTLIELLGVIVILGILISLATVAYSSYLEKSKIKSFEIEENSFISATRGAYLDCLSNNPNNTYCKNHSSLENANETDTIYLKELINDTYIDPIKNPYDTKELCNQEDSYVIIKRINDTNEINSEFDYTVCLICGDKQSKTCK